MDDQIFKDVMLERMTDARDLYVKDLEALDHGMLDRSPGKAARPPYDFTYEVVFVNLRIAKRLRGEDPGKADIDGWMKAPDEFRDKTTAVKSLAGSVDEVIDAWKALPANEVMKTIVLPKSETSPLKLAELCVTHLTYHDAQLNYVQALHGDDEMHWD